MTELKRSIEKVVDESELPKRLRERVKQTLIDREVDEKAVAQEIVQAVSAQYESTRVDPLEPVGTVSAQSIGEPGTQMSIQGDESILIRRNGSVEAHEIGALVDLVIAEADSRTFDDHEVALAPTGLEVLSLDRGESLRWKRIEEVSRHAAPDELLELQLASDRTIRATAGHAFVTRGSGGLEPTRSDALSVGDELPVVEGMDGLLARTDGGTSQVPIVEEGPGDATVVWEEIVAIETVSPETEFVYDVSVEGLETFTTAQGVVTHNTMNTFHYAGVAEIDVTQGLPRLIELVDARKQPDTPMMTVYLEDEYADDREKAHEVVWQIEATRILSLGDVSTNVADMRVTITLNEETLEERMIEPETVRERIESQLGVEASRDGTVIEFGPTQPSYRELLQLVEDLRDIVFKGIDDVSRVVIRKEELDDGEEFVLYTEGSAFGDVLDIDGVDASRTITNDIHEIHKNLGVEAARESIINETMETLEEQGLDDVNVRHLMLVADIMTNNGEISSIGRHGISGAKESVLARAAFEVTVNHLLDAAVHGEIDTLSGVTENVIVGKPIKLGTGDVDLRVGTAKR